MLYFGADAGNEVVITTTFIISSIHSESSIFFKVRYIMNKYIIKIDVS